MLSNRQAKVKSRDAIHVCLAIAFDVRYWNGWWDEPKEGTFTDVNNGQALGDFQPWYLGEPNGKHRENCGIVWVNREEV